jgi:tetratricopeptide (TPR) repeat protein
MVGSAPLRIVLAAFLGTTIVVGELAIVPVAAAAPPTSDEIGQAQELYQQGRAKFEMADYGEAIALWKEAYSKLPDSDAARPIKNDLVYNISEAQIRAYEIDQDVTHLRKARVLLNDYLRNHERLYGTEAAAVQERAAAKARLEEVDRMLEKAPAGAAETAGAGTAGGGGVDADAPESERSPSEDELREKQERAAREQRLEQIRTDPELSRQDATAKKKIVTGAVLGGVGITLAVASWLTFQLTTPVDPVPSPTDPDPVDEVEPRDRGAVIAGIVLGVGALGLLGAGAALFGIGMKRRKELRRPTSAQAGWSPWAAPGSGGAVLTVRF